DLLETHAAERECLQVLLTTDARAALTASEDWHRLSDLGLVLMPAGSGTTFGDSQMHAARIWAGSRAAQSTNPGPGNYLDSRRHNATSTPSVRGPQVPCGRKP